MLFLSCRSNPESPSYSDLKKDTFFPLAVGNIWYYNFYGGGVPIDTTKYNEKKEIVLIRYLGSRAFYLLRNTYYNDDGSINSNDSIYYYLANDTLFKILTNEPFTESSIKLSLIFPPANKSEFIVDGKYEGSIVENNDSIVVFSFWEPNWADSGWNETYKKNIGMINTISGWGLGSILVRYAIKN